MAMVKSELNIKQVIKDYRRGMTLRAIADKHYSNRTTIRDKLILAGVYRSTTLKDKIAKDDLENLLKRFGVVDIAELYGVSHMTIYRLIKKYKIKRGKNNAKRS